MFPIQAKVKLNDTWKSEIDALVLAFVPSPKQNGAAQTLELAGAGNSVANTSGDAVVVLTTFDRDKVLQLPLRLVRIDVDALEKGGER